MKTPFANTMIGLLSGCFIFLLCVAPYAQAPALPTPPDSPKPAVASTPAVPETIRLRKELADAADQGNGLRAQLQLCQGQLAPMTFQQNAQEVAAERAKIVATFEATNPGYTIDLKTLAVTKKGPPK
jgi:hypothetical protein